jgi:hypothetical protein
MSGAVESERRVSREEFGVRIERLLWRRQFGLLSVRYGADSRLIKPPKPAGRPWAWGKAAWVAH